MKFGHPRLVSQCHILCGAKLLHLRILFDGESYLYDMHIMRLTAWRLEARSVPSVHLSVAEAKALVEEQAQIICGVGELPFKWESPNSAPKTGGRANYSKPE